MCIEDKVGGFDDMKACARLAKSATSENILAGFELGIATDADVGEAPAGEAAHGGEL